MKHSLASRILAASAATAALCLTVTACSSDSQAATPSAESLADTCAKPESGATLSLGVSASLAYAHAYLAERLGFFDDENIDVEFTKVSNPADTLPLIGSGQIDAAFGGLSAGFLNAVDRGLDIRIAAARGEYPADQQKAAGFYVRSDLVKDGTIKSVADLEGRTIGLAGGSGDIGNSGGYFISRILEDGGIHVKDVTLANVTAADTQAAFSNKAIDAAFLPSPFGTNVEESGLGMLFGNQEVLAGETSGGLIIGPNLAVDDRVKGVAFLRALMRAADVMQEGDYRQNPEVVTALLDNGFKDETIINTPLYEYHDDLALNPETFDTFQNTFRDMNGILSSKKNFTFEDVTDEAMRKDAVSSLSVCGY